jgi:hypothetical protein
MTEINRDQMLRRLHKVTLDDLDGLGDDPLEALSNAVKFIWLVREVRSGTSNSAVVLDESSDDLPSYRGIGETDLDVSYNLSGNDLVVCVNKAGVQVSRVRLVGAHRRLSDRQLRDFSQVSPDFAFRVGANKERMLALGRTVGLDAVQLKHWEVRLALL